MAKHFLCSPSQSIHVKFRESSFDLLTDFLVNLNKRNKDNINSLSKCSRNFKDKRLMEASSHHKVLQGEESPQQTLPPSEEEQMRSTEYIFLITKELRLDPLAGYHAIELLQRFMEKRLTDLLATPIPQGAAANQPGSYEDAVFEKLKEKFPFIVFTCVQIASKLSLHSHIIDNNTAVRFLHSVGHSVSKQALLESELMVLKGLEYKLNGTNPLTFVEILLEVLGHNESSIPVERLHQLCQHVLQFVSLQRTAIYDSLLVTTTQCVNPRREQRHKFVTVTEDCMLLGVGVIAVATFILYNRKWEQIVGELSHITGISVRSISDFAHVTLMHIVSST